MKKKPVAYSHQSFELGLESVALLAPYAHEIFHQYWLFEIYK